MGCRKRKEHEDFAENEAKFSKQSPAEDSVTYLMRKWASSTETQEERDAVCPPPVPAAVLDEVSLQLKANLLAMFDNIRMPLHYASLLDNTQ